jgi:hypothetical protein
MAVADTDRRRLLVLVAVLAVVLAVAAVRFVGRGSLTGGPAAADRLDYQPHDLPPLVSLETGDATDAAGGSSRNPFAFGQRPTPTPMPVTPRPTLPPRPTPTPQPTPTPRPDGKTPPVPFNREFIGFFGPARLKVAAFRSPPVERGGTPKIEVSVEGGVLPDARGRDYYIVHRIGLESVEIRYVGYEEEQDYEVVPLAKD